MAHSQNFCYMHIQALTTFQKLADNFSESRANYRNLRNLIHTVPVELEILKDPYWEDDPESLQETECL